MTGVPYATISFISMMAGILLVAEILKERIKKLNKFIRHNGLIFNGLNVLRIHKYDTRIDKLDSCGCNCKDEKVKEGFRKVLEKRILNIR